MPTTTGLELFLRNTPLSPEEEIAYVESQAKIMARGFARNTLSRFKESVWTNVKGRGPAHITIWSEEIPLSARFPFSMETQGIFWASDIPTTYSSKDDGSRIFCGFTRSAIWITARVHFRILGESEKPTHVKVQQSDIGTILDLNKARTRAVVSQLYHVQSEIVRKRRESLEDAESALRDMRMAADLYRTLNKNF